MWRTDDSDAFLKDMEEALPSLREQAKGRRHTDDDEENDEEEEESDELPSTRPTFDSWGQHERQ